MIEFRIVRNVARMLAWVTLVAFYCFPLTSRALDDTFPVLQVGTHTYTNVTVTTKAKNYIFILHSTGMVNIKVADLPPDLQERLGYHIDPPKPPPAQNAKAIAKQALAKVETPAVKAAEAQVVDAWRANIASHLPAKEAFTPTVLGIVFGGLLLVHLLFSYCCQSICIKAGGQPGALVWLPVFQLIPMLRAASMSRWWFLLCLIPIINVLPYIIWTVKIVHARSLNALVTISLLLPGLSFFGFLLLAFAGAPPAKEEKKGVEIMTLEAA